MKIREDKGKTQKEVAESIGVAPNYLWMIESGQRNPSVKTAKKIADDLEFEWKLFFEN